MQSNIEFRKHKSVLPKISNISKEPWRKKINEKTNSFILEKDKSSDISSEEEAFSVRRRSIRLATQGKLGWVA